jgi:hypothetical protein
MEVRLDFGYDPNVLQRIAGFVAVPVTTGMIRARSHTSPQRRTLPVNQTMQIVRNAGIVEILQRVPGVPENHVPRVLRSFGRR